MEDLILLVGNPNAGKSTLFNALTRGHAKVGNWHGVTVGVAEKSATLGGNKIRVADLPGIYSMQSLSMEEKYTRDFLLAHEDGFLLFVSECGGIERTVPLIAEVLSSGRRAALVLTKRRAFERQGGKLDTAALSAFLGIPVVEGEGRVKQIKNRIGAVLTAPAATKLLRTELPPAVYTPVREGFSRADKLLTNGFFCFPLFLILLLAAFFLTFASGMPGDLMKSGVERLFQEILAGKAEQISSPVLASFLADGLIGSVGGVLCFLPQIAMLYLFLILLEESGLMSRLACLTDGALSKVGLNGRAVFSLLMGFGCTAAAILTTRGLDDKRIQRRTILCLPYISCSAKLPVYLALSASFFKNPFVAVLLLYTLGVGLSFFVALFLKDREKPSFIMELAPLTVPRPIFVCKSLLFQIKQFIIKTATVILAFFMLSWILSSFTFTFRFCGAEESMLAVICGGLKFLFAPIGMGDWRIAYAALSGLVAKENVAGAISMFFGEFPFSGASAFALSVFVLACSPCVSAIAASAKEIGWKRSLLYAVLQTVTALLLSYFTYFALLGGGVYLLIALAPLLGLMILGRKGIERVRRNRKHTLKKLHGRHGRAGVSRLSSPSQKP